jgi:hypothetical protein
MLLLYLQQGHCFSPMAWEMSLTENLLLHIVPDEAIPEMEEMSAR